MTLRVHILGCGSSAGVPRPNGDWGKCDPLEPRNRRLRCSILVERETNGDTTRVLIDTTPDLRAQMLQADVTAIDAVLFTHDHADHTHGIDDLRVFAYANKARVPVYMDDVTRQAMETRFAYCFRTPEGSSYPPILKLHRLEPLEPITITGAGGDIEFIPFLQIHGDVMSLGFRFGRGTVYSPDISGMPEESMHLLDNLDLWIVDALRPVFHPSHFSQSDALEWIEKVGARKAILTHLHIDMDYRTLERDLPDHVRPAYDGMVLDVLE